MNVSKRNMKKKRKTVKDRVIDRLNKGFGLNIPYDVKWYTHQATGMWVRSQGAFSWYLSDLKLSPWVNGVGSCISATECLRWERWFIGVNKEIFPYLENDEELKEYVSQMGYRVENIDSNG